jgi:hypothetical protein
MRGMKNSENSNGTEPARWKRLSEWFMAPKDSFAKTLANGSTVLNLEKAKASPRFEELKKELEEFEVDLPQSAGNGTNNGLQSKK